MDTLIQDLRYALRSFRLSPGFAIAAITLLALGTGANTAIFQLFDAVRLRALPVKAPQELVELRIDDMAQARGNWLRTAAVTNPLWEAIHDHSKAFAGMSAWADEVFEVSPSGESQRVNGLWVSGDFFHLLDVTPILGRVFTSNEDRRGCGIAPGAVISYGYWQRNFGGSPSVLGRTISVGKNRIAIIGVTPSSFFGLEVGRTFDVALPVCSESLVHGSHERLDSGITWWLTVMARLKPGMSIQQASAISQAASPGIFRATLPAGYPMESVQPYLGMKLLAIPAGHGISKLREQYSTPLILLLGIAGLVLLIACANLASLMLARASTRQREVAIRLAIGASHLRLLRQFLAEGLLLAVAGAGAGLLLSRLLSRLFVSFLTSGNDSTFLDLGLNLHVFAFAAGLVVFTLLAFMSAPLLRAARIDPAEALKSASRAVTAARERLTLRRGLVACQIAVAVVLLVGSLLFMRTLRNLEQLNPGFQPHGILIADIDLSNLQLSPTHISAFRRELLQHLRTTPGVKTAAEATVVPLTGADWTNRVWMAGSDPLHARVSMRTMVGPEYFRTLETPLLAGRDFNEQDLALSSKVAIVNEEFAHEIIDNSNALGKSFWIEATPYDPQSAYRILGVAQNTKHHDLRESFQPIMFLPLSKAALNSTSDRILIRSNTRADVPASSLRAALAAINPEIRYSFRGFDTWIQESLLRERLLSTLSALFGILATALTAIGIYGVISYMVALRTNEIGIRMALGADRRAVIRLVMREAAGVLAVGLIAGIVIALVTGRATESLLFGLKSGDLNTFAIAGLSLAVVALAASYLPARRAASMNPLKALHTD